MPMKLYSLSRKYFGVIRILAVVLGFVFVLHFTHRECSRNADQPIVRTASLQPRETMAPAPKNVRHGRSTELFHATAYCLTGITKAGVPAASGLVSADPDVIPLGSMIYVESPFMSGIYQVMDTGSAIKGKIIDIFIPSYEACKSFGRRMVKVKVLRYGFHGKDEKKSEK